MWSTNVSLSRSWYQFPVPPAHWRTLLYLLSVLSVVLGMLTLYFAGVLQFALPDRVFWLLLPLQAALAGIVALVWARRSELPVTHYLVIMLLAATLLAWFLHDTGGHTNPLVSLLLLPVAMTAGTMPWQATAVLAAVVIFAYGLLTRTFVPLQHPLPGHAIDLTQLHLLGMWLTFILSCVLLVVLVAPLAAATHRTG
jgi:two-component system sensor histidine kinase RegB